MQPGDKVRLVANPARIGILGNETDGPPHRQRVLVNYLDGTEDFVLPTTLEKVESTPLKPYDCIKQGKFAGEEDLRAAITFFRLSGKLANLIYSLNTTNTQFLAYQFKPVLHFLDSPSNGILIADEVGLGKTIEAGLIWTELRARLDAKRLLVVCPAMLREKWKEELANKFGVKADIVDAKELLSRLNSAKDSPHEEFALIASIQGIRPPRNYDDPNDPGKSASAQLGRFLEESEVDDPLVDMVVVDEAHYLRNRSTQTSLLGQLLRPLTSSLVLLSATPIQLRSTDLFNLLNLLDEDAFPYEMSFQNNLESYAPIVSLRDRILREELSLEQFKEALDQAIVLQYFEDSEQLNYLVENPPSQQDLQNPRSRAELADQLDRINPLSKVVTRTLKRDVHENRVLRQPHAIRSVMSNCETEFYDAVTEAIREYCEDSGVSTGFMLTIPQRQMASCMAAACRAWQKLPGAIEEDAEELVYEIHGEVERSSNQGVEPQGRLNTELGRIARSVGSFKILKLSDTKYQSLLNALINYWREYPGRKVVLFSFYRNTLAYLAERLYEDGYSSVKVHGGMDKHEAIAQFKDPEGPNILLSSEVASEGVDLQFSSLVVNYDLPWNPMKIEQRIGRIDRIGQESEKIFIWNFIYANTIDERVYDRLLDRLDIFTRALGSTEGILGEKIQELTAYLLTHKLTAEQEIERINQTAVAIEEMGRRQDQLEQEATNLIAHGEFIQNKVKAAEELGRYIRGIDLLSYVQDFILEEFEGSRLINCDTSDLVYRLELSIDAKVAFKDFLERNQLVGRTQILSQRPKELLFENIQGVSSLRHERITQDHPLVRFVTDSLRDKGRSNARFQVSAVQVPGFKVPKIRPGIYAFCVCRWSVSGTRETERLEYALTPIIPETEILDGDDAEFCINTASFEGRQWLSAQNEIDKELAAYCFSECLDGLDRRFDDFVSAQGRADRDRLSMMKKALSGHVEKQASRINERIQRYRQSNDPRRLRMIAPEEGKLKKLRQTFKQRVAELESRSGTRPEKNFVSGGVLKIH